MTDHAGVDWRAAVADPDAGVDWARKVAAESGFSGIDVRAALAAAQGRFAIDWRAAVSAAGGRSGIDYRAVLAGRADDLTALASSMGALAVFDPSNPGSRTLREDNGIQYVEALADGLGNVAPFTQAAAAAQPFLDGTWMRFSGSQWLDFGAGRMGNMGLFADESEQWCVAMTFASNQDGTIVARAASTNDRTFQVYLQPANQPGIYLRSTNNSRQYGHRDGNTHALLINWDGVEATIRDDQGNVSTLTAGSLVENVGENILVGARSGGSAFHLDGHIGPLVFFDTALASTNQQLLLAAMMDAVQ